MTEDEKAKEKELLAKTAKPCVADKTNLAELLKCCAGGVYSCSLVSRTREEENRTEGVLTVSFTQDKQDIMFCIWRLEEDQSCSLIQRFRIWMAKGLAISGMIENLGKVKMHSPIQTDANNETPTYVS
jgi:hypothetical protein